MMKAPLFALVLALLIVPVSSHAQTASVISEQGPATCVQASEVPTAHELTLRIQDPARLMRNLRAEAIGGGIKEIRLEGEVGDQGQPLSATYRLRYTVEAESFCPGRLQVLWDEEDCRAYSTPIEVYKRLTRRDLDRVHQHIYGLPARIEGPTCITPGEPVTFSVHPFVSNCSWLVGQDHYEWTLPQGWTFQYNSGDSSSITALPPPDMGIGQVDITVAIGTRCNGSNNILTLPVQMSLVGFHITSNLDGLGNLHGQAPLATLQDLNQGSVPSHASTQFVLTAVRPGGAGSLGVEWDNIPAGFTLVSGTLTSPTITVQASAPGHRATFTARLPQASGECGRAVASFRVNRGVSRELTGTAPNQVPYNRIRFQSYRGNDLITTDDRGCFDSTYIDNPGVEGKVTISLTNSSASQPYVWNSGSTFPAYPVVANPNGWTIVVDPTGQIGTGQDFSVAATQYSLNDHFNAPLDVSGWHNYDVILRREINDNVLRLARPNIPGAWNPTECPSGQFDYAWFFVGRYNGVDYSTPVGVGGPMFDGDPTNTNNAIIQWGSDHTYSGIGGVGEGYFYVIITSKANSTCPNNFSCYRKRVAYPVSGVLPLPPGNGEANQRTGADEGKGALQVTPNPASGSCQVKLSGPVPAQGKIQIYNGQGKLVRSLPTKGRYKSARNNGRMGPRPQSR